MINHLEPIDMAMVKAIHDNVQHQITEFLELPLRDQSISDATQSSRVHAVLTKHGAYKKQKGGDKK